MNRDKEVMAQSEILKAQYDKILDSASISPTKLTIDYRKQISTGSPLIFGGAHMPYAGHDDAWDKIADSGVTMIRRDFFIEQILPENITLEDYKNNVNDVQNINNWNLGKDRYKEAKSRGLKVMGIIDYAPSWLTFSGTPFGHIKDWGVYEDLVKKTYEVFRNDLDYLEIWNEPTFSHFNDTKNSSKSMEDAYIELAIHTIKAVREVDKKINDGKKTPLGGLVADNPKFAGDMLVRILQEPKIIKELSFISYHSYGHTEPSSELYKGIMQKYGYGNLPIFLTEWNYSSEEKIDNIHKTGNKAITYTANQLFHFINQNIRGANYYMLEPVGFDSPGIGIKYMGFYRWENGQAILLPQARTWRILSKQMGLGAGESRIYATNIDSRSKIQEEKDSANITEVALNAVGLSTEKEELNSIGFVNSNSEHGTAIVNSSQTDLVAEIEMKNTAIKKFARAKVFYANAGNEAKTPVYEGLVKANGGKVKFNFYLPAESVIGIKFEEEKQWYELFN